MPRLSWNVAYGSLPPGFVLDLATGIIFGNTPGPDIGTTYRFAVTATDSDTPPATAYHGYELPVDAAPGEPPPPQQAGYARLVFTNCHTERRAVHIWTRDATTGAPFIQHGTLDHGYVGDTCLRASPLVIPLPDDGHIYEYAAVDINCTTNDPTIQSCRKLWGFVTAHHAGQDFHAAIN